MKGQIKMWWQHSFDELEWELQKIGLSGVESADALLEKAFLNSQSELLRSSLDIQSYSLKSYVGILMGIQVSMNAIREEH